MKNKNMSEKKPEEMFDSNYEPIKGGLVKTFFPFRNTGYAPIVHVWFERNVPNKHMPKFYLNPADIELDGFSLYHTKYEEGDFTVKYMIFRADALEEYEDGVCRLIIGNHYDD